MLTTYLTRFVATAALLLCTAAAQDAFEVASVKPFDQKDLPIIAWRNYPGGRVVITHYSLLQLISYAYFVPEPRITGGPAWAHSDSYNITAKPPAGTAAAAFMPPTPNTVASPEVRSMMRTLLADRFGLKLHRETREMAVRALVVDKGGPKFQPTRDPSAEPKHIMETGEIEENNVDLKRLINMLENHLGGTVVDHTGLTGKYDYNVKYAPGKDDAAGLPFDKAVEAQLGLKLKPAKEAIEILVIDDAKKPAGN